MSPLLICALLAGALLAAPAAGARPDPLDPKADVPQARHDSAFKSYRPGAETVTPGDWKQANDTVRRIGGWRTYAREAAASAPASTSTPAGKP